jgi:uncharacterized membrane protein YgcG
MELIIVAIIVVAVVLVLLFAGPTASSNRSIVNEAYKSIEMPMYKQSTYSSELNLKPDDKSVLIVPDDIAKKIFTRDDTKQMKSAMTNGGRRYSKSNDGGKFSEKRASTHDNPTPSTTHVDIESYDLSCTPSVSYKQSYSSRSCTSPVESHSSSSSDSSSSSCDSGGGSCGGGD